MTSKIFVNELKYIKNNMKKLILGLVLFLSFISYGQTIDGLKLGMPSNEVISGLKQKGFIFSKSISPNGLEYLGHLNGEDFSVIIYITPQSLLLYKVTITKYRFTWVSSKQIYETDKMMLIKYFGKPTSEIRKFVSPHRDGDGYEMNALFRDKIYFETSWMGDNINLSITSEKSGVANINFTYQHPVLSLMVKGNNENGMKK